LGIYIIYLILDSGLTVMSSGDCGFTVTDNQLTVTVTLRITPYY
jgi:hypothetical protein